MFSPLVTALKHVAKYSLDNYIVPGTVSGTEILWLYFVQWKRDLLLVACASCAVLLSYCELPTVVRVLSEYKNGSDTPD